VALTGLAALPATALLSGCVTTQQVAARERLVDARIRASQVALALGAPDPEVHVAGLSLLRARGGTAIVAELHNASGHPLTDLPVLVGLRTRTKHTLYLNRAANADYFDNHVVSIPAYGTVTWVFTSGRRLATAGTPVAQVGTPQIPEPPLAGLPQLEVKPAAAPAGQVLSLSLTNRSGIPQYSLPVYAVATRGGRLLAAGQATVVHLGTHGTGHVRLTLLGSPSGATVTASALPTIFH
jgi:hypothetical protein